MLSGVMTMEKDTEQELSSEDLEQISRLQFENECKEKFDERPGWQRIMAWILLFIVVVGIGLYCYWQMVPQT